MHDINLYEKKIINDEEFPVQMFQNQIRKPGVYFTPHWHEHIEIHYFMEGRGVIKCNQKPFEVKEGSLVIINSSELHEGISYTKVCDSLVLIFEMDAFSKETANFNAIFQTIITDDSVINELLQSMYREDMEKQLGYKMALRGKIYELITYLLRNYVVENLSNRENSKRIQNLTRLNTVLQYIENNYTDPITIGALAELIHLSEYRFCHLFKESIGQSPLSYINEVRLKKAHHLLEQKEMTIAEVAATVGFQDYNNFGRLFRKMYGYAPSKTWSS